MSESHTHGPWRGGKSCSGMITAIVDGNRVGIGEMYARSDAFLVAAAPEMFALLERCISVLSTLETPGCIRSGSPSLVKDCRAVVAKAKGTTP